MHLIRWILSTLVLAAGVALAQAPEAAPADRSVVYGVSSVGGSGVLGSVYLGAFGEDATIVVVDLNGTVAGASHPSHLHRGDCGSGGGIRIPLADVDGATGLGVTLLRGSLDAVLSMDLYLNVHRSSDDLQSIVACGEVGMGAARTSAMGMGTMGMSSTSTSAASSSATGTTSTTGSSTSTGSDSVTRAPATASYGLFTVEGSGIQGQVQLTEDARGGTRFVVTLTGIEPGRDYPLALYRGDCGPDRPKVTDLRPVGELDDDPFASVTHSDLDFHTLTSEDFFLYVFRADDPNRIAACGEVGLGANR